MEIPRWLSFTPGQDTQIHGFCDASEKAYCVTIYLHTQAEDQITSTLLVEKK